VEGDELPPGGWAHLLIEVPAAQEWLRHTSRVPQHDVDVLVTPQPRTRLDVTPEGTLLAVLSPPAGSDAGGVGMWIRDGRLVTTSSGPRPGVDRCMAQLAAGAGPTDVFGVLMAVGHERTSHEAGLKGDLDEAIAKLERRVESGEDVDPTELRALRVQIADARSRILPFHDLVTRLAALPSSSMAQMRAELREMGHSTADLLDGLDRLAQRASMLRDELEQATRSRTDRAVYLITILSGVFLPLTFVTGLLGVNLAGIPGSNRPVSFTLLCIGLGVLGISSWRMLVKRGLV
jgi:zinc transporter